MWYFVTFKDQTEALLDSRSKINVRSQAFAYQNVRAQKIDGTTLETYGIVVFIFSV